MYIPKQFEETRVDVLHEFIRLHPLGALVRQTSDELDANHLPFEIDSEEPPYGRLCGHVARANPIVHECAGDAEVLVIFQGPNAYVSPSWYPTKSLSGKVVPTWNYAVVHAYGRLRFFDDRLKLVAHIEKLTGHFEARQPEPWKVTDAPADFLQKMSEGIVGFEITINRLIGKWKLGQHRSLADQQGVVQGLRREGTDSARELAEMTERCISNPR